MTNPKPEIPETGTLTLPEATRAEARRRAIQWLIGTPFDFNAQTRRGPSTERLRINFHPDHHLKHDHRFTGFDYRERLTRKAGRWINRLCELPQDERNYLLSLIVREFVNETHFHAGNGTSSSHLR